MLIFSRWGWSDCNACAQLSVNALRRELRGEPYAGKPHVRFGEGGVSYGSPLPLWISERVRPRLITLYRKGRNAWHSAYPKSRNIGSVELRITRSSDGWGGNSLPRSPRDPRFKSSPTCVSAKSARPNRQRRTASRAGWKARGQCIARGLRLGSQWICC
jgi:hypothetical protein